MRSPDVATGMIPTTRRADDGAALADSCHCGELFDTCRGCGAPRCPVCEPVRDEDCLWGV